MRCPPVFGVIVAALILLSGCESSTAPGTSDLSTYRHIRPFWSPGSDRIAFTNTDAGSLGIWSVDTNGSNLRSIHAGDIGGGTWSPDGQWVAFYQLGQIVARKVDSDSLRVLVTGPGSIRPTWSTDGRTLAFIRSGVMTLDLTSGVESWVSPVGTFVHWIPNTRSVLIGVSYIEAGQYAYVVQRANVDSAIVRDLFTLRTVDDCAFFVPSPDGSTVFFGRKPLDEQPQVWSVSVTTLQSRQLTTDGGDYPAVSPNGQWIAYTRTAADDGGLWLMRTDGTGKRRLTQP